MKKYALTLILLLISHTFIMPDNTFQTNDAHDELMENQNKFVIGCNHWGLFWNFFGVLHCLDWCTKNNAIPVVYWNNESAYYTEKDYNGSKNVWEYYFEPVSKLSYEPGDKVYKGIFHPDKNGIFLGQYHRGDDWPSKELRNLVKKKLIDKYIRIKPVIQKKIETFYKTNMYGKKNIGIHLRGKHLMGELKEVPSSEILEEANKYAKEECQFFIATDQYYLLEKAKETLKGKVIYCDSYRSADGPTFQVKNLGSGDLAGTLDNNKGCSRAILGEEALIDCLLLSKCDLLIHTLSHLSTAALYFNPKLKRVLKYRKNKL